MQIGLLGPFELRADGHDIDPGPPKQRTVLAMLVLHADHVVSTDQLMDAVWPTDPPRTAAHSIQIYVSDLRKAFARAGLTDVIVTRPPGYLLVTPPGGLTDVRRFDDLIEDGIERLGRGERSGSGPLREALALWRGRPLADFAYQDFALPHIERLEGRRLDALEHLASFELDDGHEAAAIDLASKVLAHDPSREQARYVEMLSLYRTGRHVEALRCYEKLRRHLADELGLEPSPRLQRLQGQILLHAPTLAAGEAEQSPATNPYKGLQAFTEEDAGDFFGRNALIDQLAGRLGTGQRLVTVLGPSGSGKSSVIAAGLVPRLRVEGWTIARFVPSLDGGDAIVAALDGREGDATLGREHLVVIDQFEELLNDGDDASDRARRAVAGAILAGHGPTIVLAVRADFYDRVLADADLAPVVSISVVPVLPLTAEELEAAITRPAERAGHVIEPRLLAALLADAASRPSALPLLQYALTELFDQADERLITLASYQALGGLRGLLSRQADRLFDSLGDEDRAIARQVLLRLVQPQNGQYDVRRRVRVEELVGTGLDLGHLSNVLAEFGRHRLLTFDHDPVSGAATVEVAHEALLREWGRLASWIEESGGLLRRLAAVATTAEEWDRAGRHHDYLLVGARLADIDGADLEVTFRLSAREQDLLTASRQRRDEGVRHDARSRRRHRWRVLAVAATVAALVTAGIVVVVRRPPTRPGPVGLVYEGERAFDYFKLIEDGFDAAAGDLDLTTLKRPVSAPWQADEALEELAADGVELVVAAVVASKLDTIAPRYPKTRFAVIDTPVDHPNVTHLQFAVNQGSFVAGVAAALTSRSGVVGFIGGADSPAIWPFAAGFEAGVLAVDPTMTVLFTYLAPDGAVYGYQDLRGAQAAATAQYEAGADVVFQAAGDAGFGVFAAAAAVSAGSGVHRWAIGVDSDQYETVVERVGNPDAYRWQAHILTSVLKRTDLALRSLLGDHAAGRPIGSRHLLDLESGAVGIAVSGNYLNRDLPTITQWEQRVRSGATSVPCLPSDHRSNGVDPAYCVT